MDGWQEVVAAEQRGTETAEAVEHAGRNERQRCLALVRGEIQEGERRGIPQTSGTMIILHRVAAAIERG